VNVDEIIDNAEENRELDFKDERAEITDLVFELVAFANSGGGDVVYGVTESDNTIEGIQNIPNPSEIEEGLHQVIKEKVDPKFAVRVEAEEYTGEMESFQGSQILILTPENGSQIHSYRESDSSILYPYRLGSTTDHLTGGQIYRFYEDRIRPGRPDEVESESETGTEDSSGEGIPEFIELIGEGISEVASAREASSESSEATEESAADSAGGINLRPSENP